MNPKHHIKLYGLVFTCICVAGAALHAQDRKQADPVNAQDALEKLKALEGDWIYSAGENKGQLAVRYTVPVSGTVVVETLFPGTDHEMVSVYHLDGDKLMMTHYCAVGNQPRMHAEPATGKLEFKFSGGSNMTDDDGHMHAMTMTFIDENHLREEWTWKQRDEERSETFEFERQN